MICTHSREYSEGLSGINPRFEGQVVNVKVNAARPLTLRVDSIQSREERRLVNDRVGEAVLGRALPNMNFAAARLFDYVSCFSVTKKSVSPQLGQVHARIARAYLHPLSHFAGMHRSARLSKKLYSTGFHRALGQLPGWSLPCNRTFLSNRFSGI